MRILAKNLSCKKLAARLTPGSRNARYSSLIKAETKSNPGRNEESLPTNSPRQDNIVDFRFDKSLILQTILAPKVNFPNARYKDYPLPFTGAQATFERFSPLHLPKKSLSTGSLTFKRRSIPDIVIPKKCDANYDYPFLTKIFGTENLLMRSDAYNQALIEAAKRRASLEELKKVNKQKTERPRVFEVQGWCTINKNTRQSCGFEKKPSSSTVKKSGDDNVQKTCSKIWTASAPKVSKSSTSSGTCRAPAKVPKDCSSYLKKEATGGGKTNTTCPLPAKVPKDCTSYQKKQSIGGDKVSKAGTCKLPAKVPKDCTSYLKKESVGGDKALGAKTCPPPAKLPKDCRSYLKKGSVRVDKTLKSNTCPPPAKVPKDCTSNLKKESIGDNKALGSNACSPPAKVPKDCTSHLKKESVGGEKALGAKTCPPPAKVPKDCTSNLKKESIGDNKALGSNACSAPAKVPKDCKSCLKKESIGFDKALGSNTCPPPAKVPKDCTSNLKKESIGDKFLGSSTCSPSAKVSKDCSSCLKKESIGGDKALGSKSCLLPANVPKDCASYLKKEPIEGDKALGSNTCPPPAKTSTDCKNSLKKESIGGDKGSMPKNCPLPAKAAKDCKSSLKIPLKQFSSGGKMPLTASISSPSAKAPKSSRSVLKKGPLCKSWNGSDTALRLIGSCKSMSFMRAIQCNTQFALKSYMPFPPVSKEAHGEATAGSPCKSTQFAPKLPKRYQPKLCSKSETTVAQSHESLKQGTPSSLSETSLKCVSNIVPQKSSTSQPDKEASGSCKKNDPCKPSSPSDSNNSCKKEIEKHKEREEAKKKKNRMPSGCVSPKCKKEDPCTKPIDSPCKTASSSANKRKQYTAALKSAKRLKGCGTQIETKLNSNEDSPAVNKPSGGQKTATVQKSNIGDKMNINVGKQIERSKKRDDWCKMFQIKSDPCLAKDTAYGKSSETSDKKSAPCGSSQRQSTSPCSSGSTGKPTGPMSSSDKQTPSLGGGSNKQSASPGLSSNKQSTSIWSKINAKCSSPRSSSPVKSTGPMNSSDKQSASLCGGSNKQSASPGPSSNKQSTSICGSKKQTASPSSGSNKQSPSACSSRTEAVAIKSSKQNESPCGISKNNKSSSSCGSEKKVANKNICQGSSNVENKQSSCADKPPGQSSGVSKMETKTNCDNIDKSSSTMSMSQQNDKKEDSSSCSLNLKKNKRTCSSGDLKDLVKKKNICHFKPRKSLVEVFKKKASSPGKNETSQNSKECSGSSSTKKETCGQNLDSKINLCKPKPQDSLSPSSKNPKTSGQNFFSKECAEHKKKRSLCAQTHDITKQNLVKKEFSSKPKLEKSLRSSMPSLAKNVHEIIKKETVRIGLVRKFKSLFGRSSIPRKASSDSKLIRAGSKGRIKPTISQIKLVSNSSESKAAASKETIDSDKSKTSASDDCKEAKRSTKPNCKSKPSEEKSQTDSKKKSDSKQSPNAILCKSNANAQNPPGARQFHTTKRETSPSCSNMMRGFNTKTTTSQCLIANESYTTKSSSSITSRSFMRMFSSDSDRNKEDRRSEGEKCRCNNVKIKVPLMRKPTDNPHPSDRLRKCYPTYDMDCTRYCRDPAKSDCKKYVFREETNKSKRKGNK